MGGCKTYGGRKTYQRTRSPESSWSPPKRAFGLLCRGFLYRKNRALTPEGGGKRTVRGGVQNPFLGGVSFVRFSTPLFFSTPPWRPLKNGNSKTLPVSVAQSQLYLESVSVHPVHGNPRTGLLRTFWEPDWVLRSPFRGLCAQGALNCPTIGERFLCTLYTETPERAF